MGKIIKVACKSCKNEWECKTGCGLSHALLQDVLQEFPEEIRVKITEEIVEESPIFEFEYHISSCSHCGKIVSVPVIRFEEGDAEYIGSCPVCGNDVSLIPNIRKAICPVCSQKKLLAEETGRWD